MGATLWVQHYGCNIMGATLWAQHYGRPQRREEEIEVTLIHHCCGFLKIYFMVLIEEAVKRILFRISCGDFKEL